MPVGERTQRILIDVDLEPVGGSRFQPTGFPDIGAALFDRPVRENGTLRWEPSLLVESAQSMANRLQGTAWNNTINEPHATVAGLPYVRVVHAGDGEYLTSSRTEAHRLASAFVKDSTLDGKPMRDVIRERLNLRDDRPLAPREIAEAVFALDPFCLIHGVFFAEAAKVWPGQPRILRAITAEIEAHDVRPADSGGVKRDHVRHSQAEGGGSTEGYGSVPYHRTDYTAASIRASFSVDLAQIAAYGLPEPETRLLETMALWEIRSLLDAGLRLRTACDFAVAEGEVRDRSGERLPSSDELAGRCRELIARSSDLAGDAGPIEVRWESPRAKK